MKELSFGIVFLLLFNERFSYVYYYLQISFLNFCIPTMRKFLNLCQKIIKLISVLILRVFVFILEDGIDVCISPLLIIESK